MGIACRFFLSTIFVCAATNLLPAAVIGYWRFEDSPGITTDSSGNGRTLTGTGSPTSYTLPGSGVGSKFPGVIPQTNENNLKGVQFSGSNRYTTPDAADWTSNTLTVEALINGSDFGTNTSNKSIAGHWNATGSQRSWLLAAGNNVNSPLSFLYSTLGTDTVTVASTLNLSPNIDYYVAVTVNMADATSNGITFYVKDLTNNGPLMSQGATHVAGSLFNSNNSFSIGATNTPSSPFTGIIDEVRISNTKLAASELFITAIPEPGTYALAVLSFAGFTWWKRRR